MNAKQKKARLKELKTGPARRTEAERRHLEALEAERRKKDIPTAVEGLGSW